VADNVRLAFLASGESVHTKGWLMYFVGKGYDVHLITFTAKPIKGVKIHELRYFGKVAYPLRIWKIRKTVKEIEPDVLHAHYISHYGIYAALSGFHPLILSAWGSDIAMDPERSRIARFFVKFALKKADLVHTGDAVGMNRLIELGCDRTKIFVQHWGVDTNLFSPKARSPSLRKKLGISRTYSVIMTRKWSEIYHVEVFIKAMPLVLKKIPDVKFIVLERGPLKHKLKELARKLGVCKNMVFVGLVPHHQMPQYLASVDVYVDTFSDYVGGVVGKGGGGMGSTTREVMACGTAQILGDTISVRSSDWFQGLVYKQLDHRDLAEKIVQLLEDEKLRRNIGEKSRKVALQICDLEKNMKKWETVYHELKGSARLENTAKSSFLYFT